MATTILDLDVLMLRLAELLPELDELQIPCPDEDHLVGAKEDCKCRGWCIIQGFTRADVEDAMAERGWHWAAENEIHWKPMIKGNIPSLWTGPCRVLFSKGFPHKGDAQGTDMDTVTFEAAIAALEGETGEE